MDKKWFTAFEVLMILGGIGCIIYGVITYYNARQIYSKGIEATALVTDCECKGNDEYERCWITITYSRHEARIEISYKKNCSVGKELAIVYDPLHPEKVIINNTSHMLSLVIFILLGILLIGISRMHRWAK